MCSLARIGAAAAAALLVQLAAFPGQAQPKTVLKLGNVQAPGMVVQTGLRRLSDLVRERTNGQVEIQVFPAAQLGSEQEMLEGVQLGTVHMFEGSAGSIGRFLPQLEAFACPFLWKSADSMLKTVRGPIGDELSRELLQKRGLRILDMGWIFGVRHLTTARTPVRTPQDMKGLKVRVQPDAIYLATVRAMGGSPTPIDANELYTALQTGVVDGQENPISNIWNRKFHEVQKYLILTGHITQNQVVVINEATFQKLAPEQRDILVKATIEAGDFQNGLIEKAEREDLAKLKAGGMEVIEPDVAAFRSAAANACRDPGIERKLGKGFYDRLAATQQ
ncbi:MAG TPA: TRAP transporter substrate-binding protein [Alphaproteobacteria bacterium]|nr:TRAP transporter substrate-binding protein [Alphaproteobacteria bacterium]